MLLTLEEVCAKYNVSVSSVKTKWKRTRESIINKYGVDLEKRGRGDDARYEEVFERDNRAITIFEENNENLGVSEEHIRLMNWDLLTFLGVVVTPMLVFRGSYTDFLHYLGVSVTPEHIEFVKRSLEELQARDFIIYHIDKTDKNYFVASLYRKVEQEMQVGITMIKRCKMIAEANNKQSWIPLLKVWVGVQQAEKNQPFTNADLERITGLSEKTISENKKLLEQDDIFKTRKTYVKGTVICTGQTVDLNGFYN